MTHTTVKTTFIIGVVSLLSVFVVTVGHAEWRFWPWGGSASSSGGTASSMPALPLPSSGVFSTQEQQIIDAVKRAQPSVVSVIITEELPILEQDGYQYQSPFGDMFSDPLFREFQFQVPKYKQNGTQEKEVGGGTAFFVTSDGLLLTNKHVVSDAKGQYTVLLNDGRKLDAEVAATDPSNDIALLRVKGSGFTPLTIAAGDDLQLGQTAIAIGNSLGEFRNTVSVGVVSGLQRSITAGGMEDGSAERLDQIIQTDAAINPGNSGGPLLNSRGEVIGMNTAIAQSAQSISFALPAAELRNVLASFQKNGRIVRPYIGVRYAPVTPEMKEKQKLASDQGVLIVKGEGDNEPGVLKDSPAEKAGLKEGDQILEADGQKLSGTVLLATIVSAHAPGDKIALKILRDGKEMTITVTLEERK
ncbi:MAG: trypsin-like peptidase domain-containing protein [Candidatus Peribacteraceae bacterium]